MLVRVKAREFQSLEGARSALVLGSALGLRTGWDKNSCSERALQPREGQGIKGQIS